MLGSFVALLAFFTPFRRLNWKTFLKFDPRKVLLCWTKNREKAIQVRACFGHSANPPKMAFLWKILNYPFQPYLKNTSFFPAKLPVFASFFKKIDVVLLIFASVRDGRWVSRRWFQPLHEGVTPRLPPPVCLFLSTNFRVYSYPTTMPSHTWCFLDVAAPR